MLNYDPNKATPDQRRYVRCGGLLRVCNQQLGHTGPCGHVDQLYDLRVYEIGPDKYVASSPAEAWEYFEAHLGEKREGYYPDEPVPLPGDAVIRILTESGRISDSGNAIELTAAEWCLREGPGFLCSSEY